MRDSETLGPYQLWSLPCLKKKKKKDNLTVRWTQSKSHCEMFDAGSQTVLSPRTANAADEHETCLQLITPSRHSSYQPAKPIHPVFYLLMVDHLNFGLHFTSLKVYHFFNNLISFMTRGLWLYLDQYHALIPYTQVLWKCCSHWVYNYSY